MKLLVTERAVTLRLRRVLQAQGKHLRIASNQKQWALGLGRYYLVDENGVADPDVDLEELGSWSC